jgi:dipeptidyl-peptidase III
MSSNQDRKPNSRKSPAPDAGVAAPPAGANRPYLLEQIDEAAVVQLYADGFAALPLNDRILVWHLSQAALAGRDIYYDQRYERNLEMREVLEEILTHAEDVDPRTLAAIHRYLKLFWINTGPYNNLTARKFVLDCAAAELAEAARAAAARGAALPRRPGESAEAMVERLSPDFFDPTYRPIVTNKNPDAGRDILLESANNLHFGVSMADLEGYEERFPLNSRLVKRDGVLIEEPYRVGGRYGAIIARIAAHLEQAIPYASAATAEALRRLIALYRTGEAADREAYDIAWVRDRDSTVDTINGFVEVYMDARGVKGAWEALVCYVNPGKTEAIRGLAEHAQWFEDRMPWDRAWRKAGVKGVSGRAIDVVIETGDSGPVTPVGINLPNDQMVREEHGSKSVSLSNVVEAYDRSMPRAFRQEFSWSAEEVERAERWSSFASELTTNMHEVIGHGSGRIAERLRGNPQGALKEYYSGLEEARADLVALYFLPDPELVELGLVPAEHHEEIVRAEYESYARNALAQLRRVREGDRLEEDHMRNRQLIVNWLIDHTQAIEVRRREGRTYYVMTDPAAFREGVGRLLADVQRIKAEGDYEAARALFDRYGVYFDPALRDEVVERVRRHNLPSYTGFVQPRLEAVYDEDGRVVDVTVSYPLDLTAQMLEYSGKCPLP